MEETIKKRLEVYHEQTELLIGYYSNLAQKLDGYAPKYAKFSGVGSLESIRDKIFETLNSE